MGFHCHFINPTYQSDSHSLLGAFCIWSLERILSHVCFHRVSIHIYKDKDWTTLWQRSRSPIFQRKRRNQSKMKTLVETMRRGVGVALCMCHDSSPSEWQHVPHLDEYGWKAAVFWYCAVFSLIALLSVKLGWAFLFSFLMWSCHQH